MKKLVSENPFYGLSMLKALLHNKNNMAQYLANAWNEAKSNIMFRQLFHLICFSVGDIDRQHNIFGKQKVESDGQGLNQQWIMYLQFLLKTDVKQFVQFLPLIVEYVGLKELTTLQIKTQRKTKKIIGSYGLLTSIMANEVAYSALLNLLSDYSNSNNPFKRMLVAKFVKIPRYSKRKATKLGTEKRSLQPETVKKMNAYNRLLLDLSAKMGWEVHNASSNINFVGYRNFQKQYNQDQEYVLFSTGRINDFDQEQFLTWLNATPAGARYRVKRRLFDKDGNPIQKWGKLASWFTEWDKLKQQAQAEKRNLEAKASTTVLSDEEKVRLQKVTKDAKVTTGGFNLFDFMNDFVNRKVDDTTVNALVDKVVFNVPILPVFDGSGSMSGRPIIIARLAAALALMKNPDTFTNVLFGFGSAAYCFTDKSEGRKAPNQFMIGQSVKIDKLVDRTATLSQNFNNLSSIVNSNYGSTDLSGVAERVRKWTEEAEDSVEKAHRIEQLQQYRVVLVISDGDLNNYRSQAQSMSSFVMKMKQYFGWEPIVVLWEIPKAGDSMNKSGYFDNIQNVIHVTTWNMSTINNIFTKIHDMDVIDTYTELKSMYQHERYKLVKENTL